MSNPRNTALNVLMKIEQDNAYSNIALNNAIRENKLSGVDSSFVSALVYGVLERKITLDYIIKQYSKIPLRKIEIKTKMILRLGILQLIFMDKIPESAAVNESVNLAKKHKLQKSSGFINGILRSITRSEEKYKLPDKSDRVLYYSVKYSAPQELVKLWINSYGELNTEQLLKSLGGRPKICARVNTLKNDKNSLIAELAKENVKAEEIPFLENAVSLTETGSIERLSAYKSGKLHIQDASSQLCVDFLSPKPREVLLDICSAPGGKSFTAAQYMCDRGKIFACDLYNHKLKLISDGAKRLGIHSIVTLKRDGASSDVSLPLADKILCDVPCSGLGILSRKPEIRYKDNLITADLPELQYKILCQSAQYLANGGRLVYSTCTLNPAENNKNARRFLEEHPDFYGVKLSLPPQINRAIDEHDYEITLMPHTSGTDGFYIAVFGKKV
ncbi:MAG: 16S rRNA (cytosine(967)-C(5))-methyltransferase RsmB [Ruminococcus sp.]|nr:16S rRNA (cytosine(967)-C(5))-methyltransferase RsmB [Ruminococcus sp.]